MSRSAMCPVPPMGWNTWNTFTNSISEKLILESVDTMKALGLREAGYEYVVIDDCWSMKERDDNGNLVPDPEKFPHGMKYVADYVHANGFKFGMYSCCGTRTCGDYPASFGHEYEDAKLFASWGVDYLKYDNCFKVKNMDDPLLYRRMGLALANTGRDMVFSACQWGTENVHEWIRSSGAHLFRSTGDINDSWKSIKEIAMSQLDKQAYSGSYCHNDMDMLVVGMYGGSNNEYIAAGGCTDEEYQTHFALWCMMNSPLMIGCDVRKMNDATKAILTNKELIAINQDIECRSPYKLDNCWPSDDLFILVKPLSDGDLAIGMFNMSDTKMMMSANFWDMGLPATGYGLNLRDLICQKDMGIVKERLTQVVPAHGSMVFRGKVVKL